MNSNISTVVFDLDGTLVQSHTNIYKATMYAFEKLKIVDILPEKQFYNKIGHHFEDIFADFRIVVDDFEKFIKVYKDAYFDFIDFSELYPNVEKVLDELKVRNLNTALLTTKGQDQADKIIKHFNLSHNFDYVMGRRPGIAHKPAPDMLLHICEELGNLPSDVIIVGDTEMDILCGKNAGAKTCGVTYGYRTREDLAKLNPNYLIDSIEDVLQLL